MDISHIDLYQVLGLTVEATPAEIQKAYRRTVRRFHPDANHATTAEEEFKQVQQAYDILSNEQQRAEYDPIWREHYATPYFEAHLIPSRSQLITLDEPQVVHVLLTVHGSQLTAHQKEPPALNLSLVIDRSTSMRGKRMDQVKSAARQIIQSLQPNDTISLVTFNDRAEVVLPATREINQNVAMSRISGIQAKGGTEILNGLTSGLIQVRQNLTAESINHLILLTDGRTYGDEEDCLALATNAELDGITISGLGVGSEWNDEFLDTLTGLTGGRTSYVASSDMVAHHLREHVMGLGDSFAERIRLRVTPNPGIELQQVFRLRPSPYPISIETQPMRLGSLSRRWPLSLVMQFLIPPQTSTAAEFHIARLTLTGDLLSLGRMDEIATFDFTIGVADQEAFMLPPKAIIDALEKINLYNIQQKATRAAEEGNIEQAVKYLNALHTQFEASGEYDLAQQAAQEAQNLRRRHKISDEGQKNLKYGTRALLLAAPRS